MIACIFTIDYEIYGNGEGSLKELVYEPAKRLMRIFQEGGTHFVAFVEAAELEMIETERSDKSIDLIKQQIQDLYQSGFELGLHLHPQWYNARYENGTWSLDYSEYNLCTLPKERVSHMIERSVAYLRNTLGMSDFIPLSFRAGNWLFQPTRDAAFALAKAGIKVDSSVFKGGLQHQHKLDYRQSLRNGYFWKFMDQVEAPDKNGILLELPIHTQMVPFWKMFSTKRIGLQQKVPSKARSGKNKLYRIMDFLRFYHPKKLDFCRMTIDELTNMIDTVIQEDQQDPGQFRPIVAIGHTKDLIDFDTVESFLSYLNRKRIVTPTFEEVYVKCTSQ